MNCGREGGNCQCTSLGECIHTSDIVNHEPCGAATMSYYRRLPIDVRVAMWVDERPKFMRTFGIAAVAVTITGSVVLACWALLS
jgi:hypothetical protein